MVTDPSREPSAGLDGGFFADPAENGSGASPVSAALVAVARRALGCESVGVTVRFSGRPVGVQASDDAAVRGADLRGGHARGATSAGLDKVGQLLVPDVSQETRWRAWSEAMARQGIRSVLVTSFRISRTDMGAVTAYWPRLVPLDAGVRETARMVAQLVADEMSRDHETEQLRAALASRLAIGQAQGLLMARFGVDADQATAILKRYSQDCNIKLRDVAAVLVETGELPLRPVGRSG